MFDTDFDTLMSGVLEHYRGKYDIQEGGFLYELVSQIIYQIWGYYDALDAVMDMAFVNENSGEYIDMRAAEYGITRKEGEKATVVLVFSGDADSEIEAGTIAEDGAGNAFATNVSAAIGAGGSVNVLATCTEPGAAGNAPAGTIIYLAGDIIGVDDVTNLEAAAGGTDGETDAELLARLDDFRRRPATSGNAYAYKQWAMEVNGIGYAIVYPLANGAGTVSIAVASSEKRAVTAEKAAEVAAHIETQRPIGATVTVASVSETAINVSASIQHSADVTISEIKGALESALASYIRELDIAENEIKINAIGALIMGIDGVTDFKDLKLNNGTGNVTIADGAVPVPGEVTASEYA